MNDRDLWKRFSRFDLPPDELERIVRAFDRQIFDGDDAEAVENMEAMGPAAVTDVPVSWLNLLLAAAHAVDDLSPAGIDLNSPGEAALSAEAAVFKIFVEAALDGAFSPKRR